jgi:hypothetical protein
MKEEKQVSATRLAVTLGVGLLTLVVMLSLLAPPEMPIDLNRLESLVAEGRVASIEVSDVSIVARLRESMMLEMGGQRRRTEVVIVTGIVDADEDEAIGRWKEAGLSVVAGVAPPERGLQEAAWVGFVSLLLVFGVYHLVTQARTHRRDGSPRQRLDHARADLDAGRISDEEYERRASEISIEM